jgi:hypothetical protein
MSNLSRLLGITLAYGLLVGCGTPEDKNQTPVPTTGNDDETGSTTDPTSTGESGDTGTGGDLPPPANCGELICEGPGSCQETNDGPICVCDEGYVLTDPMGTQCVIDETCIELRFLEDKCRQLYNDAPAVSLFFAVDFCSGDAVLPEKLDELGLDFLVLENDVDIEENPESNAAVIDKDVESFVTLVLDVSDSVTGSEDLPALVSALRDFMKELEPVQGEARTTVEIFVFGRNVARYLPMTTNFDEIDAALQQLEDDPQSVVQLVNGMGTALYDAVEEGIQSTERARQLRRLVTNAGILSTGTVVVVTDGKDTSNGTLNKSLVDNTLNQVISIGISPNIDGEDLDAIGRHGSYLAPDPADWDDAFAKVATRVDQYPDRAYLLAYCSSTNQGSPDVTISLSGIEPELVATCKFDADLFASNPPTCGQVLFDTECENKECGGWLTGCGGCADSDCCSGTVCKAPGAAADCEGQDELCLGNEVCIGTDDDEVDECTGAPGLGEACIEGANGNDACNPGVSYCQNTDDQADDYMTCLAVKSLGEECETAVECETLHCAPTNADNPFDPSVCQLPAEIFDECGGNKAICESGSYCSGTCKAKRNTAEDTCSQAYECNYGICDGDPAVCPYESSVCFWAWDEKANN